MATLNNDQIKLLKKLYIKDFMSASEIASQLNCSIDAVYYAMRKHNVPRRNQSTNSRIQFDKKPSSFSIKTNLNIEEEKLRIAGTCLYWAEGYKTAKSPGVDFANSDVRMTVLFLKFLRFICGIDEKRLRILLYSHSPEKIDVQIDFWHKKLSIPKSQFTNPYIAKNKRLEKNDKMPYGLVHIRYYDKKLLRQILNWIEDIDISVGGGVV